MFPQDKLSTHELQAFAPLTYSEFLSAILIPFMAILLIKADLGGTLDHAYEVWQQSSPWGLVNHPDIDVSESAVDIDSEGPPVKLETLDDNICSVKDVSTNWRTEDGMDGNGDHVEVWVLDE